MPGPPPPPPPPGPPPKEPRDPVEFRSISPDAFEASPPPEPPHCTHDLLPPLDASVFLQRDKPHR